MLVVIVSLVFSAAFIIFLVLSHGRLLNWYATGPTLFSKASIIILTTGLVIGFTIITWNDIREITMKSMQVSYPHIEYISFDQVKEELDLCVNYWNAKLITESYDICRRAIFDSAKLPREQREMLTEEIAQAQQILLSNIAYRQQVQEIYSSAPGIHEAVELALWDIATVVVLHATEPAMLEVNRQGTIAVAVRPADMDFGERLRVRLSEYNLPIFDDFLPRYAHIDIAISSTDTVNITSGIRDRNQLIKPGTTNRWQLPVTTNKDRGQPIVTDIILSTPFPIQHSITFPYHNTFSVVSEYNWFDMLKQWLVASPDKPFDYIAKIGAPVGACIAAVWAFFKARRKPDKDKTTKAIGKRTRKNSEKRYAEE